MPTENVTDATVFVHCIDPLCRGNKQRAIPGVAIETSWTFEELGGDIPGTERSTIKHCPKSEKEYECPVCGGATETTGEPRPTYDALSGFPASESLQHFGSYKPGQHRSAEVDAVLERLADVIAGG